MKKMLIAGMLIVPIAVMADMDRCVSCHGVDFEKKALGVSKVVKDMTEAQIKASLDGYKAGKGGPMKEIMMKEVNVGVDTDAMAADVYNEIITPGFEEPDAEFIFKKRRTVRGLYRIKQSLKKADPKKDRKKVLSQIKSFAFDLYTYDGALRKAVDIDHAQPKQLSTDEILSVVSDAKSCTDHSFTDEALLKCQTTFVDLAASLSLDDARKLQKKIKPKEKEGAVKAAPLTAQEASKAIVGTWEQVCYPVKPGEWATKRVTIKEDLSAKGGMQFYSDDKCTQPTHDMKAFYTFKFGNIALGDDGKEAWEIDKVIGKKKKKVYAMLRFVNGDRVIISGATKEHDGSTPEKRKNHFDPKWEGCVRK